MSRLYKSNKGIRGYIVGRIFRRCALDATNKANASYQGIIDPMWKLYGDVAIEEFWDANTGMHDYLGTEGYDKGLQDYNTTKEWNPGSPNYDQIDEIMLTKGTIAADTNKHKGNFGEMSTDVDVVSNGAVGYPDSQPVRVGTSQVTDINDSIHQGIDGIYKCTNPPPEYIVVESKYGSSKLGTTLDGKQMSDSWILGDDRLKNYFGTTSNGLSDMSDFTKAFFTGNVQKELVQIDADGVVTRTIIQ